MFTYTSQATVYQRLDTPNGKAISTTQHRTRFLNSLKAVSLCTCYTHPFDQSDKSPPIVIFVFLQRSSLLIQSVFATKTLPTKEGFSFRSPVRLL